MEADNNVECADKRTAERYYELALQLIDCGDLKDAKQWLEKASDLQPGCVLYSETLTILNTCFPGSTTATAFGDQENTSSTFAGVVKQGLNQKGRKAVTKKPSTSSEETFMASSSSYSSPVASYYHSDSKSPIDGLSEIPLPYCYKPAAAYPQRCKKTSDSLNASNDNPGFTGMESSLDESVDPCHSSSSSDYHSFHSPKGKGSSLSDCSQSDENIETGSDFPSPGNPKHFNGDSDFIPSYSHVTDSSDLERQFLEELCKQHETNDGWDSYFQLLNEMFQDDNAQVAQDDAKQRYTYVGQKSRNFTGVDNFDEITEHSTNAKQNTSKVRSTKSKSMPCTDDSCNRHSTNKQDATSASNVEDYKEGLYIRDGTCYSGKTSGEQQVPGKDQSSSSMDASEKDFYRNLRYYFAGGKVKYRKCPAEGSGVPQGSNSATTADHKCCDSTQTEVKYRKCPAEGSGVRQGSNSATTADHKCCDSTQTESGSLREKSSCSADKQKRSVGSSAMSDQDNIAEGLKLPPHRGHKEPRRGHTLKQERADTSTKQEHMPFSGPRKPTFKATPQSTCTSSNTTQDDFSGAKESIAKDIHGGDKEKSRKVTEVPRTGTGIPENKGGRPGKAIRVGEKRRKGKTNTRNQGTKHSKGEKKSAETQDKEMKTSSTQEICDETLGKMKGEDTYDINFDELKEWMWHSGKEVSIKCGQALIWIGYYLLMVILLLLFFIAACTFNLMRGSYRYVSEFVVSLSLVTTAKDKLQEWKCKIFGWFQAAKRKWTEKMKRMPKTYDLPNSGSDAVQKMLSRRHADPYSILGVPRDASDDDLKKQYRKLAMLIHPDKNSHPQADEAFKILASAFEIIGDIEKRQEYDRESARKQEDYSPGRDRKYADPRDFFADLNRQMHEIKNTLACDACGGRHKRLPTDIPVFLARYCASCDIRHPAKEGDIWKETTFLGMVNEYYACMEGQIFNVTEWARCQGENGFHIQANTHRVPAKIRTEQPRNNSFPFRSDEEFREELFRDIFGQFRDDNFHDSSKTRKPRRRRKKR